MKVIVISDSHGELDNIKRLSLIAKEEKAERVIHLGDDYDDADYLINEGITLERVPGVFSAYYTDKSISNRKVVEILGWKFLLTHTKEHHENDTPDDIVPEQRVSDGSIDILLYGHSHVPTIAIESNVYLINPGHLKSEDKKGCGPSYAVLTIEKDSVDVTIKDLASGKTILRELIKRSTETN
jgi:putative phosphoesterase